MNIKKIDDSIESSDSEYDLIITDASSDDASDDDDIVSPSQHTSEKIIINQKSTLNIPDNKNKKTKAETSRENVAKARQTYQSTAYEKQLLKVMQQIDKKKDKDNKKLLKEYFDTEKQIQLLQKQLELENLKQMKNSNNSQVEEQKKEKKTTHSVVRVKAKKDPTPQAISLKERLMKDLSSIS